jgi:hypothetical protein
MSCDTERPCAPANPQDWNRRPPLTAATSPVGQHLVVHRNCINATNARHKRPRAVRSWQRRTVWQNRHVMSVCAVAAAGVAQASLPPPDSSGPPVPRACQTPSPHVPFALPYLTTDLDPFLALTDSLRLRRRATASRCLPRSLPPIGVHVPGVHRFS